MDRSGSGVAAAAISIVSVQLGASLAVTLFATAGPLGTVSLRLIGAAVALAAVSRPWRLRWKRADLLVAATFGVILVVMNSGVYIAIGRLPLASVITVELLGPLAVAVATVQSWRQRAWALPAGAGVAVLGGSLDTRDLLGVVAALVAATAWACYILINRRVGAAPEGLAGLCLANVIGALIMAPVGAAAAGGALLEPRTAIIGLAVGGLSAVAYALDMLALRRLPTATFGVLTSLNPAVAAITGLIILGQRVPASHLCGILAVIVASAGATLKGTPSAAVQDRTPPAT